MRSWIQSLLALFFFLMAWEIQAQAVDRPVWSAEREANENWESSVLRFERGWQDEDSEAFLWSTPRSSTALNSAKNYRPEMDLSNLPEWTGSYPELLRAFEKMRDERIYTQASQSHFLRRSTWLYPNDGCFARAVHAARSLAAQGWLRPGKIFSFGRLRVKTKFDPRGMAYWWFHVAAAYRMQGQTLILDPSVDPTRPLFLKNWLALMSKSPENVRVAACDTYAYLPSSLCQGGSERQERSFLPHQKNFLPKEWNRLLALKMNPEKILADDRSWIVSPSSLGQTLPIEIPGEWE